MAAQLFSFSIIGAFLRIDFTSAVVSSPSASVSISVHKYFNSPLPDYEMLKLSIFASDWIVVISSVQLTFPFPFISTILRISSISSNSGSPFSIGAFSLLSSFVYELAESTASCMVFKSSRAAEFAA